MYNYWIDLTIFKAKIKDELDPMLKVYVGESLTVKLMEEIKQVVSDWLAETDEAVFSCEIKVDTDIEEDAQKIKLITISPIE